MVSKYLSVTSNLANHLYWFYEDLKISPTKEHYGLAINFSDIKERKDDFLSELISTVVNWVYNRDKVKTIFDDRYSRSGDFANAANFLTNLAYKKFRPGHPQGQLGELLLFNLVQHYYEAAPVLRKQRITTSTGHERFGSDAIHYKEDNGKHFFILGESKCYESKYKFNDAFAKSLDSIVDSFNKLDTELDLFVYDDFLESDLEDIVKEYKGGTLKNVKFELVSLVIYNETEVRKGTCEATMKDSIRKIILDRCASIPKLRFSSVDAAILARINYIIFPIWKLDEFLEQFKNKVGSEK